MIRQNKFVKVKFLSEWMGNPEGSTLSIIEAKAEELKKRGTVEFVDGNIVGFREEIKTRSIDEPPNHKMISAAPVKKAGRPKKIK
jgi:hypothetical protein